MEAEKPRKIIVLRPTGWDLMKALDAAFGKAAMDQNEQLIFIECDKGPEATIARIEAHLVGASHWVILTYDVVLDMVGPQLFDARNYRVIAVQAVLAPRDAMWWSLYGVIREQTPQEAMQHAINIMAAADPELAFWMAYIKNTATRRREAHASSRELALS